MRNPTHSHTLSVHNLSKSFTQGATRVPVFNEVEAQFAPGSSVAITGASGSGKSTLLHLLAGLETPDQGTVTFAGKALSQMSNKEREQFLHENIGLVFQAPYLIAELSVIENVMIKGMIGGMPAEACKARALQLLRAVGLEEKADAVPATLSGGQQQRAAIARALFITPAFIVADEPTGNVDRETGKQIIDMLLHTSRTEGAGLIIASHDPYVEQMVNEVWRVANHKLERIR